MSTSLRVLVTRPAQQAADWVARLRDAGVDAAALPLIAIEDAPDAAAVQSAWAGLASMRLVVFVSPNAAERFVAAQPAGTAWPPGTRAAAVGPGTSRVLRAFGLGQSQIVEPASDAPQFDSEALWAQLRTTDWQGARVLVVRGDGGREWLADTLRAAGAEVGAVCAYRRAPPRLDAAQRALLAAAQAEPRAHLWFFSSSEAIDNLDALVGPGADWSHARALATHPRITARAQRSGFRHVAPSRPDLESVRACIQSLRDRHPFQP
ncbi:MAG: uroporphyrinogen-III synthase [Rhizobacter sp.]|nr:uroporphyrinogen-III synthase [Rhizobacter sp.]